MKRNALITLILFFCFAHIQAEIIDSITAMKVAKHFYLQQCPNKEIGTLPFSLAHSYKTTKNDLGFTSGPEKIPLIYIFNVGSDEGFVIVTADDIVTPVLGYSETGSFSTENQPPAFIKWMDSYCDQIIYAKMNDLQADNEIQNQWEIYVADNPPLQKNGAKAVAPLIQTTWGQSTFYNALCPGGSLTGCVATAMAQIMKYWNWPTQGAGNHCYTENDYGQLCANFGSTVYDWSSMPINVSSTNTAVATLMYHCGLSVDMDYSPSLSGAFVLEQVTPNGESAEKSLKLYFGYSSNLYGVQKDIGFTDITWKNLLKSELNASRPVLYAGYGNEGGHCFVCDGYNSNDYFHFNWGWDGQINGYFLVSNLNPSTYNFTSGQVAVVGIQPISAPVNDIRLYSAISVSPSSLTSGQAFDVSVDIANYGTTNFTGDFGAAIFDSQGVFIDFVNTYSNQTLNSGYYLSYTFSNSGMNLPAGTYYIGIYSADNTNAWTLIDEGTYTNPISITVQGTSDDIALIDDIHQSPTTLYKNQSASFTTDIANDGTATFTGWLSADIFSLDGTWIANIQEFSGCSLPSSYMYDNITFTTNNLNVEPGMYALYILYSTDYSNWNMVGSQYYSNPIYIEVLPAPITADPYEVNNTQATAYNLALSYSSNTAHKKTTGSNIHIPTDEDYYKIVLPTGYNYTINAFVNDSYSSSDGVVYTDDVLFSYRINSSAWSETYDDFMPSNINVTNGGTVYFPGVSSKFNQGIAITGKYLALGRSCYYN